MIAVSLFLSRCAGRMSNTLPVIDFNLRHGGFGSIGIAAEQAGSNTPDFRQHETNVKSS